MFPPNFGTPLDAQFFILARAKVILSFVTEVHINSPTLAIMASVLQEQVQVFQAAEAFLQQRVGIITMDVFEYLEISLAPFLPRFSRQNICELVARANNHGMKGKLYFRPEYLFMPNGRDQLMTDIQKAAMEGGDSIVGCGSKDRKRSKMVQYFRCQCAQVYRGEKFDKVTKEVVERDDYVQCKVQHNESCARPGRAGINGSKKTSTCRRFSSSDDCCPFNLSIFVDDHGYYIKLNTGNPTHEFHGVRENLRVRSKMLDGDSTSILKDMNSARATPGVAVSLHFQRSARLGRPTVLSNHQIRYIMSKANGKVNASDCLEVPHEGTMDELYNHLEKDGLQYISLLQKLDENNQGQLINETKHGRIMIDYSPLSEDSETAKAIQLTNSERARRPLISNEQEMVVTLAYSTPFEI